MRMKYVLTFLLMMLVSVANATGDKKDDRIDIVVAPDQKQAQDQNQEQDQIQDQHQSQSSEQANSQSLSIENRTPGRAFVGGGDSTAPDTKVRALSGGWLTGAAALRWDVTDKDARKLRTAERYRSENRHAAADQLECSIRFIYKAIGGDPDSCYTELAASNTDVKRTTYNRRYEDQIEALSDELRRLQDQIDRTDEACDRRWKSCVDK